MSGRQEKRASRSAFRLYEAMRLNEVGAVEHLNRYGHSPALSRRGMTRMARTGSADECIACNLISRGYRLRRWRWFR